MRLLLVVAILLFAALGVLFGALNSERIAIDLYATQLSLPKGATLIAAVVVGWLLGGLVAFVGPAARQRREIRRLRRALAEARREPAPPLDGTAADDPDRTA